VDDSAGGVGAGRAGTAIAIRFGYGALGRSWPPNGTAQNRIMAARAAEQMRHSVQFGADSQDQPMKYWLHGLPTRATDERRNEKEKLMRYMTLGVAALTVALFSPGTICKAQQRPSGSYQQTCRNIEVRGSTLYADCQDTGGGWQSAQLSDFPRCTGEIGNNNGILQCTKDGNSGYGYGQDGQVPSGSYQQSCRNIQVRGSTMYADCQDTGGGWQSAQLSDFPRCSGEIGNNNGILQCTKDENGGYGRDGRREYDHREGGAPRGSYSQSCENIRTFGHTLQASCQKRNGKWKQASLGNFDRCRGEIVNNNGKLRCSR
jgi:hypothetical protein